MSRFRQDFEGLLFTPRASSSLLWPLLEEQLAEGGDKPLSKVLHIPLAPLVFLHLLVLAPVYFKGNPKIFFLEGPIHNVDVLFKFLQPLNLKFFSLQEGFLLLD